MYIFLDESGDLGLDLAKKGSSKFFVITLLVLNNSHNISNIVKSVKLTLKRKLNYKAKIIKHELKGVDTNFKTKMYFYKQMIKDKSFSIHTILLDKGYILTKNPSFLNKERIYNKLSKNILTNINFTKEVSFVNLIIDKSKRGDELSEFNTYLKLHIESLLPIKTKLIIEHKMSKDDYGLQAVDMFSWGIFRKYERNDTLWYEVFKNLISTEKFFKG